MLELIDEIVEQTNHLLFRLQILLFEQRLREQELLLEGKQVIEQLLGYEINGH
jgi:hypothetical protein